MEPAAHPLTSRYVTFRVEGQLFGISLDSVVRIERAAAVTPLPGGPACLLGALNHRGRILPVLDLRRRLRFPTRPLDPEDHFLLVRCRLRVVVVPVDRVEGIRPAGPLTPPGEVVAAPLGIEGLVAAEEGLLLVHDAERILDPSDEVDFEAALAGAGPASFEPAP